MANTYSHNCMMHRDTMLKFRRLFDLAKYLGHKHKFQRTLYGRGLVAHIKFWDSLFIWETNRARKLKFGAVVGIRFLRVLRLYIKVCPLGGVWGNQQPHILFWDPLRL